MRITTEADVPSNLRGEEIPFGSKDSESLRRIRGPSFGPRVSEGSRRGFDYEIDDRRN